MLRIAMLALAVLAITLSGTSAQDKYPTKPIEIIVPYVAGASTDLGARVMAQVLETRWQVPVRVINKPGGNTVPAVTEMMSAKPDGTLFLMDNIASSAMLDTVVKNLPYKVFDRSFVAMTGYTPMMFIVHVDSPFKTLGDAVEALKSDTAKFTWTSLGGVGGQDLAFRQFFAATGVEIGKARAIALKGGAEAVTLTAGGHVRLGAGTWSAIAAPLGANKLRVLAVAGNVRWPRLPDAPTTTEAGYPEIDAQYWIGVSGPPGLAANIVDTWNEALRQLLADKEVQEKMLNAGLLTAYLDPEAMMARVERDRKAVQTLFGN
ncbi:MAG: tripartite tricarboxylate transporter substrate binding protein [Hyphomicrobiaceae bacterium]|nr:tripartite tricarboxylate transporter substrate binding protein [Hyphomicrobiaceae bacterium]